MSVGKRPSRQMTYRQRLPWQLKMMSKILLSRLPFSYGLWKKMSLFKHGDMDQPAYATRVIRSHFDRVHFSRKEGGFVALELGPGDSLYSAIVFHALGAKAVHLIDIDSYAEKDFEKYKCMIDYLERSGYSLGSLKSAESVPQLLKMMNCQYHCSGLSSLSKLPDASVDFICSQAVLEHIRLSELDRHLIAMRRVLRSDGVCSHRIDLKDHLGGALNNLRFTRSVWESNIFAGSGFYTNRVRFKNMLERFRKAGFDIEHVECDFFESIPIERSDLADDFRGVDDEDLMISGFDVVLRPA